MQISAGLDSIERLPAGSVVTVGNFDGPHVGHRAMLARARELAAAMPVVAITFEPHPTTVLRPELTPPRLATRDQKLRRLAACGVTHLVELAPTPDVLSLEAHDFYQLLRRLAGPGGAIVEGSDFYFGKGRAGSIRLLSEWSVRDGVRLEVVDDVRVTLSDRSSVDVSSSLARWLLAHGRVVDANLCLGAPFALQGTVEPGERRGRTIGFPTANLRVTEQIVPAPGVYAASATVDDSTHAVALSIGTKPTFAGDALAVEAHLIDYAGDLYGRTIEVELLAWLRDQMKFPGIDALKRQLAADVERSRRASAARPRPTGAVR